MNKVVKTLKESKSACWIAWACLVVPMFASYFFDDMFSTISHIFKNPDMLELGWNTMDYGFYAGGYSFLCVWGGLIVCGMLLDKWGVRVTGSIFVGLMAAGAALVYVTISTKAIVETGNSLYIAYVGCMLFGLGSEIAGVAVTRSIAKWFKGKSMACALLTPYLMASEPMISPEAMVCHTSTIGSISLGQALDAGRILVPKPAAGMTAFLIFIFILL